MVGYWDPLQRQEHLGVLSTGLCGWMRRKVGWDDETSKSLKLCAGWLDLVVIFFLKDRKLSREMTLSG